MKTRLSPPLAPEAAAALYAALLHDCFHDEREGQNRARDVFLFHWPPDAAEELRPFVPPHVQLRAQRGADLAERMAACFADLFAEGFAPVVLRGTDAPALPAERVHDSFAMLTTGEVDAVLGPDPGGGYYLVGLAAPAPELFSGIVMGGKGVFATTRARALEAGCALAVLPMVADIDTIEDLRSFAASGPTPEVARWLAENGLP